MVGIFSKSFYFLKSWILQTDRWIFIHYFWYFFQSWILGADRQIVIFLMFYKKGRKCRWVKVPHTHNLYKWNILQIMRPSFSYIICLQFYKTSEVWKRILGFLLLIFMFLKNWILETNLRIFSFCIYEFSNNLNLEMKFIK